MPNATGPEPRTRTRSSTSAASNTERSHFSPAVNLSSPAGSVTLTASPQPASAGAVMDPGDHVRLGDALEKIPRVGDRDERTSSRPEPEPSGGSAPARCRPHRPSPLSRLCHLVTRHEPIF